MKQLNCFIVRCGLFNIFREMCVIYRPVSQGIVLYHVRFT